MKNRDIVLSWAEPRTLLDKNLQQGGLVARRNYKYETVILEVSELKNRV